jgi:hypothetical protein
VTPTDAELRAVYDNLVDQGVIKDTPFNEVKPQIAAISNLNEAIALKRAFEGTAKKYDVSVNPRYTGTCTKAPCDAIKIPLLPVQLQDGSQVVAVYIQFDTEPSPAVIDGTPPATPTAPTAASSAGA